MSATWRLEPGVEGEVHGPHPAAAELLEDPVRAEGADLPGRGRRAEGQDLAPGPGRPGLVPGGGLVLVNGTGRRQGLGLVVGVARRGHDRSRNVSEQL